jgi:hypothetical protein
VYFQLLEWPAEVRRGWGLFIAPTNLLPLEVSEHRIYLT